MSISNSYPTQKTTLNLDFANSGKLDSRISFSRADSTPSNVHYRSNEKHKSSENLVTQSDGSDWTFSSSEFTKTASQAAPDGSTNGTKFAEKAAGSRSYIVTSNSCVPTVNQEITFAVWLKQTSGSRDYQQLRVGGIGSGKAFATFNLSNGTVDETGGTLGVSASVNAGPTGWYQCILKFTPTATTAITINLASASASGGELPSVTGDTANSYTLFGAVVSNCGTVLNETSGSIHREFAPLLKTSAANEPRFEHDPITNNAEGLLVESQSTNLATYGSDLTNAAWNPLSATAANAAIGPDGTLSAAKLTSGTGSGIFPRFRRLAFLSTSKTQTFSVYVKPLEYSYINISQDGHSTQMVHYNLTGSGSISSASGCSGLVEQCGNGWYRLSFTHTNATSSANLAVVMQSTSTYSSETGNSYDGMLFASAQLEDAAAASSFIGTTSSTVTRAADSCSVDLSSFYTGGELSGIVEAKNIGTPYPTLATLTDSTANQRILLQGNDAGTYVSSSIVTDGAVVAAPTSALTAASSKVGFRCDTDDFGTVVNGGTVATDTSGTQPATMTTLHIGQKQDGNFQVNGHIGRLSLYSAALSNLELQSLTSNP